MFFSEMKDRIIQSSIFDLSAQLAYYFLISFFPFLYVVITLMGYLPFSSADVLHMIHSYMPSLSSKILGTNLEIILNRESMGLLSLSILVTVYLASFAFHSFIRVLDMIYQVVESRTLWKEWIVGILLMLGLLLGFFLSLVLSVFGDVISNTFFAFFHIAHHTQIMLTFLRWFVSSMLLMVIFWNLYMFAPNVKVRMSEALPGAIFTTFAWQLSSLLFSYYVDFVDYSYLYGNLGSAMILIGWFYWSSLVMILGGMVNASFIATKAKKL